MTIKTDQQKTNVCLLKSPRLSFELAMAYIDYYMLYNNQINARALIGQSAVVYCAGKPTEKSRVFWIII